VENDTIYVALDDSKRKLVVAMLRPGATELEEREIPKDAPQIMRLFRRLEREGPVQACYEAGVSGYDLYRQITARIRLSTAGGRPRWLLLAEVGLAHEVRPQKLSGRGLQHDASGLHHVAAVRNAERHPRVLFDEQDCRALTVDVLDDAKDRLDQDRCQPHRRLVEQEEAGSRHQRTADGQHLLLAA